MQRYPEFVAELHGLADGAAQPFTRVFLMNVKEELSYFLPTMPSDSQARRRRPDHCSDYLVSTPDVKLGGHNEDSALATVNHTLFVDGTVGTAARFVAYSYAGELPTVAFGLNTHGVGFTLNFVQPTEFIKFGVGRNFISRQLLTATSFEDVRVGWPLS